MNLCLLFWRCLGQRSTQGEQSRAQGAQEECLLHYVYTLAGYVSIPSTLSLTHILSIDAHLFWLSCTSLFLAGKHFLDALSLWDH